MFRRPTVRYGDTPAGRNPLHARPASLGRPHRLSRVQAKNWRLAFFGHLVAVRRHGRRLVSGNPPAAPSFPGSSRWTSSAMSRPSARPQRDYQPTDPDHRARSRRLHQGWLRERLRRPVVMRSNWLDAYKYLTDKGKLALNDYAQHNDPFSKIGKEQVVGRGDQRDPRFRQSFRVEWIERHYVDGALAATERWSAIAHGRDPAPARQNQPQSQSPRHLHRCHQLVQGARLMRKHALAAILLLHPRLLCWLRDLEAARDSI